MRLPTIQGLIRRRILANFRVDPEVFQHLIPSRFTPKLYKGFAIAGVCLIRLEEIRPKSIPAFAGVSSENAAHRFAVQWEENGFIREGVFISRRDTSSRLNQALGGRFFPGEHHHAKFDVADDGPEIRFSMRSADDQVTVELEANTATGLPSDSIFKSLEDSSNFFEGGSVGYSVTAENDRLDGLKLETKDWRVEPLEVRRLAASFFEDKQNFPKGSAQFDHALIMRNIAHEWRSIDDLYV
jgi:uncharacterized protein YqjF (DUF2071 family)